MSLKTAAVCACLAAVVIACSKPSGQKHYEVIEAIALKGFCKEDHANKAAFYAGVGQRLRDKDSQKTFSTGIVSQPVPSIEAVLHSVDKPFEYQPPQSVYFADGLGDISSSHLILHGVASKDCEGDDEHCNGIGFAATCNVEVVRRGKSADEMRRWILLKMGGRTSPSRTAK